MTPELLSTVCKGKKSAFTLACEKLTQYGYFQKYTLIGYGQFFVLSSKGMKIFASKDSARCLGLHHSADMTKFDMIEDSANSALARVMLFRSFSVVKIMDPDCKFGLSYSYLDTDGYILRFPDIFPEKLEMGLIGLVSESADQFDSLKTVLGDTADKLDIIAVTGLDLRHAKALAAWLCTSLSDKLSGKRLWYLDYETETFYNYADDSAVSFGGQGFSGNDTLNGTSDNGTETISAGAGNAASEAAAAKQSDCDPGGLTAAQSMADDSAGIASDVQSGAGGTAEPAPAIQSIADGSLGTAPDSLPAADSSTDTAAVSRSMAGGSAETAGTAPASLPTAGASVVDTSDSRSGADAPSPKSLSDSMRAHFHETTLKMLSEGKFYCAAAYLRSLAKKYAEFISPYTQLAYAVNDPMAECLYSSLRIFQIYYPGSEVPNDYYVLSAVLRNYFLDHSSYDYMLQQLQSSIASISLLEDNPWLNQVIYTLQTFKSAHNRGIDFYADYRQKKREAFEKNLAAIRSEAAELYDKNTGSIIKENASHRRVLETKKLIFAKDSDLVVCLEAVKDDNRDFLGIIKDFLVSFYIKDGAEVAAENIDPVKIDRVLDSNWDLAAGNMRLVKRSSDLMSSLRMNLFKLVKKVAAVLCNYVSVLEDNSIDENDRGFIDYKRARNTLLQNIRKAVSYFKGSFPDSAADQAGQSVLCAALGELAGRLDGSYDEDSNLYFYLGFLKNDQILLDEDYLPVLDDVNEIEELSAFSRIEEHFSSPETDLESRLVDIFKGRDDYGSAVLILQYLRKYPETVKNKDILNSSIENAVLYPRKDMENKRRGFIEDLELAQSYGQIDNTAEDRKEALIQIMDSWYEWAMETDNYGFFYKILASIRRKIKEDAQVRSVELMANLSAYQKENPGWQDNELVSGSVNQIRSWINSQNYAAAEDLLNRLIADDLESDANFIRQDYLDQFLREYTLNSNQAGTSRFTLQSRFLKGHNKDARGAGRLIENWPKGSNTSPLKIRDLLLALGFAVEEVTAHAPIQGKDHYQATLRRPVNGRKSNYKHPISVFGSEAEEKGFRVVNIFGKMDAGRLIDTFKEIGAAKNTLILLDHTLTLPDRRELARKVKTEFSSKTFLVIDRVVLVYLANHYSETAVNRMLMAVTIPFAACQPYVSDSAKIMPPEIFMGRKNELEKIESASGVNIVYGGRQLGKSALLRMARNDINRDENGDRAILVDLKGLDHRAAARKISGALFDEGILETEHITENWDELSRDIKNRLRDTSGPGHIPYLLLLMDEADVFIESCETADYRPFDALKDIQGIGPGRFKFVVAGLRNIVRFKKNIALSNNSVLTHLSSLTVTPFKSAEARELLEIPLSYLGFRFPDDNKTQMLISTIFGTTNYFPGLLQLYCAKLVEAMGRDYAGYSENETPPYIVREEHIKKALSDKTLEAQIREKFFITLKYGDDDYYYLIALLTAFNYHNNKGQNGCSAGDILSTASSYGIARISALTLEKAEALMEEMRELNVLQYAGGGCYRFARHNFCQMMGSVQEIDDKILEYAIGQGD